MSGRVVVGYEGGPTGRDALAFAQRWSQAAGSTMVVVTVHPGGAPPGIQHVDAEWTAYERTEAEKLLTEAREAVSCPAEFRRVEASSASHGLTDLLTAEPDTDQPLLVLGSRRSGGLRRTFPGSTAERMLHGAPAPVVVVPWGYADDERGPITCVTAAFIDTPDGRAAVDQANRFATQVHADQLTVLSVVPATRVVPGLGEPRLFGEGQRADYQADLDAAVARLADAGGAVPVRGELRDGPVVDALVEIGPKETDLLVCGSRGYGPVRSVLLGGVSSRVVRHARVPVAIVPRAD
jgi:nucleotide-binding universal stress UspA family protein